LCKIISESTIGQTIWKAEIWLVETESKVSENIGE
jgi:hypothetical protein